MEELMSTKNTEAKKRTEIEEIENGFVIIRSKEWQDEEKGWQYETKKYFSETNPLEDVEKSLADNFKE